MAVYKRGKIWWYEIKFAGHHIRESAGTPQKSVAALVASFRRLQLRALRLAELTGGGLPLKAQKDKK